MTAPLTPAQDARALPPEVVSAAVDWLVHLWSGTATDDCRARWQQWRDAHPTHERAWQQIETAHARLGSTRARPLSGAVAVATLARRQHAAQDRRRALRGLGCLAAAGVLGWAAHSQLPWQAWRADVRTARGEQRRLTLPDGTQLQINTATVLNVRYDAALRRLQLLEGELLITTAHDPMEPARPFVVDTSAGRVRALGTRFTVRHDADHSTETAVAVFEGAVEVRNGTGDATRVPSGQAMRFSTQQVEPATAAPPEPAWAEGVLVASNMRLADFVAELRRYRSGAITLSPAVADLRLSGVFPLADTDRILQSLAQVLPVEVRVPVRYWVRIGPLAG